MNPFIRLTGTAIPFGASNVDTDMILPGRYLKTITRAGLGKAAFEAVRSRPGNLFDRARYAGAPILIAGGNFGCGSSREHAPWALADLGIRVIVAPSFADIFAGNAFKNGLLLVDLPQAAIDRLMAVAPTSDLTIDLEAQTVSTRTGESFPFEADAFRRDCLLKGLDEIGLTEALAGEIDAYEASLGVRRPWLARHAGASRTNIAEQVL